MGKQSIQAKDSTFKFVKIDLKVSSDIMQLFEEEGFELVCNLAAQAGVRYSIENPSAYIDSNVVGFANILEGCRHCGVQHLVYASSSSIYGSNKDVPFKTDAFTDQPISLYAATKKSNELMAYTYSHLYKLPTTGLRFFTVYGAWGRPDMAYFLFTKAILKGHPIKVFNDGKMSRDFTYIDDIVEGLCRVVEQPSKKKEKGSVPHQIYNIGNNAPTSLLHFIEAIEKAVGKTAQKQFLPLQAGDMVKTYADVSGLLEDYDFRPTTPLDEGVANFVTWYKQYYKH
ncbi:MAG: NAD-dependent epimerase/dehydratase family protein [Bacteroidota bacterium]